MTFTVYAASAEEVKKRLDRIAAKAARYSVPFAYTVGEEHPATVNVYGVDHVNSVQYVTERHTVAAVDFNIECDELIKANGWTVRARVEHGDKGNIVTALGSKPAEPAWFKAPAHCDHCKANRFRKVTYFVENESGEVRQVGRACLHDYTGINPATAAMWAEVRDLIGDDLDCSIGEWSGRVHEEMYPVPLILAHAYDVIQAYGYRKSDQPGSTRKEVKERVLHQAEPSAEALEQAERINAWLVDLEQVVQAEDAARGAAWKRAEETDEDSDKRAAWNLERNRTGEIERNGITLALSGYAKTKHFGLLAYMPLAYERYLERKAREEKWRAERLAETVSKHIGTIGQRITITAATAKLLSSWEGDYGMTYLYKFTDEQGNVFIWYASRRIETHDGMTLKATVKNHNERDGIKQTVVTRCKAA